MNTPTQALLEAAQNNDAESIKNAIANGASPHSRDKGAKGQPILVAAVLAGSTDAVRALLELGASPHDTYRGTPVLAFAGMADRNNATIALLLLKQGANPVETFGEDDDMSAIGILQLNADSWDSSAGSEEDRKQLWDALAEGAAEHGLMSEEAEPARSHLLWYLSTYAFGHDGSEPESSAAQLLNALDRQFGAALWNTPIGQSLSDEGWTMAMLATRGGDPYTLSWLLERGADPTAETPASETSEGYPTAPQSLLGLAEDYRTYGQSAREKARAGLMISAISDALNKQRKKLTP